MAYLKRVEDKNYVPKKFDEAVLLVSKVQAHIISNQLDRDKLLAWATDDKKVKNTFLRFQKENVEFRQILITELGKN